MKLKSMFPKRFTQGLYLQVKTYNINIADFSIAHISDLHFDSTGKFPTWVANSIYFYLSNNPVEILCVTGDIVDKDPQFVKSAFDWLHSLPVNYIIVSPGNHDSLSINTMFSLLPSYPKIKFSINQSFIYRNINFISGADKGDTIFYPDCLSSFYSIYNPDFINIVLSHNPNSFLDLHYDLPFIMLSGHTHGGQIAFADTIRSLLRRFISNKKLLQALKIDDSHDCFKLQGTCTKNNATLYINNGLGTHSPGRYFCPPQLTIFK